MSLSSSTTYQAPPIDAVANLRARLWDSGFRPVAIYNAHTGRPSAGKVPKGTEWQNKARLNPPEAAIKSPDHDALNTGILCDGFRAIDVDIDDRSIADQIKAACLSRFGETSVRYRANSPRVLLLYRAAEGQPEKRVVTSNTGKLEVLGKGQQFVAFGRHDSGVDLQWLTDAPGDIQADQLPAITEEDVTKILAFAGKLLGAEPENHRNGTGAVSVKGLQSADALQVIAAVCAIPNNGPPDWEAWNRVGMAIWAATGGAEAGRAAFHAWSQQNPAYELAETNARWDHYRVSPPSRIGAGTLFHMAKQATTELDQVDDVPPPADYADYDRGEPLPHVEEEKAKEPEKKAEPRLAILSTGWKETAIPPRPWVAPGFFLRGAVTMLSGMGSAGKSSLFVAWSAAASIGRPFGKFHTFDKPVRVINYNIEDDQDEQKRRYSAIARQFGVPVSKIMENLLIVTPSQIGTLLQSQRDGGVVANTKTMDDLETLIEDFKPDLLLMDPFVELHTAEENDNTAVRAVMARLRSIAIQHKLGEGILHHTRKGTATPGDPDQIRGASAIVGAARVALTITVMTDDEAQKMGINPDHRRDYFRLDGAKKNYSRIEDGEWFERQEHELDNGDFVAVPLPYTPIIASADQGQLLTLEQLVAKGSTLGPWSPRFSSDERSFKTALERAGIRGDTAKKECLKQLLASGLVEVANFYKSRKSNSEPSQGLRTRDGEPRLVRWADGSGEEN